jgi:DNA-directed RNA polymerase specialized sigma24 family protein
MNESILPCNEWQFVADAECNGIWASLNAYLETIERRLALSYPKRVARDAIDPVRVAMLEELRNGSMQRMNGLAQRKWMWVSARNAAATIMRQRRLVPLPHADSIPAPPAIEYLDELALVAGAVDYLPSDMKQLIQDVYFEDLTPRAAARRQGIAEATFRRRHKKALLSLRAILQRLVKECEK